MTKEEREALLKQIASSQDSENTLTLLGTLRTEFDAMDTSITTINAEAQAKITEANKQVDTMRQNYIDRFFSAPPQQQKKDEEEEPKTKTYEQLFKMKGA
jgi:HAMP domain-containing protein